MRMCGVIFRCLLLVVALWRLPPAAGQDWTSGEWRGERAWSSVSGTGWTAVVSEERARLIALIPPGGSERESLLFADLKNEFSWGGHRFWLGPQAAWASVWPPPADWETGAAARVEADGPRLRVEHRRTDADYPPLTRRYEWRGGRLHCAAEWSDARFQGIHIIQLPPEAVVRIRRLVTDGLPLGYALLPIFRRNDLLVDREVSPAVAEVDGDVVTLRNRGVAEKIGVAPGDIVADVGGWCLAMIRGHMSGMSDRTPDLGLFTQVFLGSEESVFTEIEQLTPLGDGGVSVAEIILEPSRRP